jgi:hypothetical protein
MRTVPDRASTRKTDETPTPTPQFVVATIEQLRDAIRAELAAAIAPRSEYVDDTGLARHLDTGIAAVRRLAADGAPCVHIGDRRRWRLADVDAWLRDRGQR